MKLVDEQKHQPAMQSAKTLDTDFTFGLSIAARFRTAERHRDGKTWWQELGVLEALGIFSNSVRRLTRKRKSKREREVQVLDAHCRR
jgi:hypothetical protein